MKTTIKYLALFLVSMSITLVSCGGDDSGDDDNPTIENGECMDFVTIDNNSGKVIYLDFVDNNNGWAIYKKSDASHDLVNTSDAGATWQIIDEDFEMDYDNGFVSGEALQFVTATNGIKLSNSSLGGKLTLQYTTDKGATWTAYDNPFIDTYGIGETFASNGTHTLVISEGTTYTAGWTYKTVIIIDNATMEITFSENVKYNYMHYPVTIETHAGIGYHYATDGTITAIVTENSNTTGNLLMAQSTDNGETWTITSDVLDGGFFNSSSWVNDTIGYVAVGNYSGAISLYKTTNGGTTWSLINNEPPKFQMIRFTDENNGIGVTDFDFYYTSDGGASWTEIEVCKNSEGQYIMGYDEVIAYPSVDNGWVAGSMYHDDFLGSDTGLFNFTGE